MKHSRHHVLALLGATLTSGIALSDAVVQGITGRNSLFSDNSGHPGWIIAGDLVHGLTYAALTWVLIREHPRFREVNRVARGVRCILMGSLVALATGFLTLAPVLMLARVAPTGPLGAAWVWLASIAFAGMIVSSLLLGIALLRTNALGYGGRLLGLLTVVVPSTIVLGFLAPQWAHPAYIETTIHFGVALLGATATVKRVRSHTAAQLAKS